VRGNTIEGTRNPRMNDRGNVIYRNILFRDLRFDVH
jgi:nitrous oxidase accessory protein NosD